MFTCCLTCRTLYRVQSADLRKADGQVRCGRCGTVFYALETLSEVAKTALEKAAAAAQQGAVPTPAPPAAADTTRSAVSPSRPPPSQTPESALALDALAFERPAYEPDPLAEFAEAASALAPAPSRVDPQPKSAPKPQPKPDPPLDTKSDTKSDTKPAPQAKADAPPPVAAKGPARIQQPPTQQQPTRQESQTEFDPVFDPDEEAEYIELYDLGEVNRLKNAAQRVEHAPEPAPDSAKPTAEAPPPPKPAPKTSPAHPTPSPERTSAPRPSRARPSTTVVEDSPVAGQADTQVDSGQAASAKVELPGFADARIVLKAKNMLLFDEPDAGFRVARLLPILLMLLLLSGQWLYMQRVPLAGNPNWRPLLEVFCGALNCDLPLPRAPQRIEVFERIVQEHPTKTQALWVELAFVSRAEHAIAYPVLELQLSDVSGNRTATRRFQPKEYLPAATPIEQGLAPNVLTRVKLELAAPAYPIVSFRFEFY